MCLSLFIFPFCFLHFFFIIHQTLFNSKPPRHLSFLLSIKLQSNFFFNFFFSLLLNFFLFSTNHTTTSASSTSFNTSTLRVHCSSTFFLRFFPTTHPNGVNFVSLCFSPICVCVLHLHLSPTLILSIPHFSSPLVFIIIFFILIIISATASQEARLSPAACDSPQGVQPDKVSRYPNTQQARQRPRHARKVSPSLVPEPKAADLGSCHIWSCRHGRR